MKEGIGQEVEEGGGEKGRDGEAGRELDGRMEDVGLG